MTVREMTALSNKKMYGENKSFNNTAAKLSLIGYHNDTKPAEVVVEPIPEREEPQPEPSERSIDKPRAHS